MIFKKIALGLLSLCLLGTSLPSEAGIASKGVKGYVAAKVVQKAAPVIAKKIIQNKAKKVVQNSTKDSTKPLLKKELKVGEYGKMSTKHKEENLDYHHIPSTKQMEKYNVKKNDAVSIGMQHDRHTLTRSYKSGNKPILKKNETARQALARDIKDAKTIYQDNGKYSPEVRKSLKEVIQKNKEKFPHLFKKQ